MDEMRLLCLLVCASAVAIACAGADGATFPGRNGLVVSSESTPFGDAIEVNATGGGATPVLPSGVALAGPVVPSPDGTRLAYTTALFDAGPDFMLARPGGADQHLIAPTFRELAPDWSPDGSHVAFTERVGTESQPMGSFVDVANADGSDVRHIAAGDQPIWSPDGNWIAYTRRGSSAAFVVHPDGSGRPPDRAGHVPVVVRRVVGRVVAGLEAPRDRRRAPHPRRLAGRCRPRELAAGYYPSGLGVVAGLGDHRVCRGASRAAERAACSSWRPAAACRRRSLRRPRSSASPGSRRGRLTGRGSSSADQTMFPCATPAVTCTSSTSARSIRGCSLARRRGGRTVTLCREGRGGERSGPAQTQRGAAPPGSRLPRTARSHRRGHRMGSSSRSSGSRPTETQAVFSSYDSTACTDSS